MASFRERLSIMGNVANIGAFLVLTLVSWGALRTSIQDFLAWLVSVWAAGTPMTLVSTVAEATSAVLSVVLAATIVIWHQGRVVKKLESHLETKLRAILEAESDPQRFERSSDKGEAPTASSASGERTGVLLGSLNIDLGTLNSETLRLFVENKAQYAILAGLVAHADKSTVLMALERQQALIRRGISDEDKKAELLAKVSQYETLVREFWEWTSG